MLLIFARMAQKRSLNTSDVLDELERLPEVVMDELSDWEPSDEASDDEENHDEASSMTLPVPSTSTGRTGRGRGRATTQGRSSTRSRSNARGRGSRGRGRGRGTSAVVSEDDRSSDSDSPPNDDVEFTRPTTTQEWFTPDPKDGKLNKVPRFTKASAVLKDLNLSGPDDALGFFPLPFYFFFSCATDL